jgi:5'-nucleotidase/UDP-sugar diphosphatase
MRNRIIRVAALLACALAPLAAEIRTLTVLHLNDMHARLTPLDNGRGGFAALTTAIKREREGCKDCILLNAGDLVQGSPVSTIYHGEPIFQIANLMGFDAFTLGNHEFDYGWLQVKKFLGMAKYPVVTSNLVNTAGELMTAKPYVILKVNGLRVAVIGVMTESLPSLTIPEELGEYRVLPVVETVRKYAREALPNADLIVALGHIGGNEEQAILEQVPEVSVIVSGHIHSGMQQPRVKDGRVQVRVRSYGEELGRLDLKVDTEKKALAEFTWKKIAIDPAVYAPDAAVDAEVKKWEGQVSAIVDKPVAISKHAFTKPQMKELIQRAIREETGADFAWMNSGGIRDSLPEGQLLERSIWNVMPFDDVLMVGTFKGSQLPPAVVGDRKIEPDKEYTLAVTDYTAQNQGTGENFRGVAGLKFDHRIGLLRDLLIDWFRKAKVVE